MVNQGLSAAVVLLSLGLLSCAPKAAPNVTVTTSAARQGRIERRVEFTGVLVPNRTVNVFTKLMGIATKVTADVGDRVTEGQLLVQIDTKELNAQLQVAKAGAAGVADQASQAKIGMETARLNLELAQRAYDRTKTLLDTKIVTQSQLDDAQTRIDLAKNAFDNASRQYQTVNGSGLAQAQAQVNSITVQISNSTITSPISGVVTNRNLNAGEMATMSGPLISVADVSILKLQGNVSQEDVVRLTPGDSLSVSVDAMPGTAYEGKITQVGPVAASTGQYFPVVVSLKNDGRLLAGMTATATLSLPANQGIVLPLAAVQKAEDGKAFVFVIAEGKALKRPVTLGVGNGRDVLVLSGLAEGENVAVKNAGVLQDGMEVSQ